MSRSGYYAWRPRLPPNELWETRCSPIKSVTFTPNRVGRVRLDGRPRVHAALQNEGTRIGPKRVTRLIKEAGLKSPKAFGNRKRPSTAVRSESGRPAPDLLGRDFAADRLNELWVAGLPDRDRDANLSSEVRLRIGHRLASGSSTTWKASTTVATVWNGESK